jgi:hypothetical protein
VAHYLKSPGGQLDYSIDWAAGYLDSQTITQSHWTITPVEAGGLALSAQSVAGGRVTATLSGGVPGHVYAVQNLASFSDGRSDVRSIAVRVEER